jgi:DNA-binding transcriptional LysR family regulator
VKLKDQIGLFCSGDEPLMELRQLEQFVAVAEERHFTRAAARCHIAQSALSTSIQALERELGAALFLRTTRRVQLTEAGRALLAEARRTLTAAAAARDAVHDVQNVVRGSLRVGGIPTPGFLAQAAVLARFRTLHPRVEIRYTRGTSMSLIAGIQRGELDLALVTRPSRLPADLAATDLLTEPVTLVCRPDHRLAQRKRVSPQELRGEIFVTGPPGSVGYEAIDRVYAAGAAERNVPFEVNDVITMLEFVANGLGITLLPEHFASSHPDLRAIPLTGHTLTWTLAAVTPSSDRTTAAARALLQLLPPSAVMSAAPTASPATTILRTPPRADTTGG